MAAAAPEKTFFDWPSSENKMKPLHWDKLKIDTDVILQSGCMWDKVYLPDKPVMDEFGEMFSQKEVKKKEKVEEEGEPKKEKVTLLDQKLFQNLSIMLHKLPKIPEIQQGLLNVDTLERDQIEGMLQQVPPKDELDGFLAKQNLKPLEEYEAPEKYCLMVSNVPEFEKRLGAWLFSIDFKDMVSNVMKPIKKLDTAFNLILDSKYLPVACGILRHFGNMMNHGNKAKGNAAGFGPATLTKLDACKDKSGKVSLLKHLVNVAATVDEGKPLDLADENKFIMDNGLTGVTYEDIEKGILEAGNALKTFQHKVKKVAEASEKSPMFANDPFKGLMDAFYADASAQHAHISQEFERIKELFLKVLKYWSVPSNQMRDPKPEAFFQNLLPFFESWKRESTSLVKERNKKNRKKGQHNDKLKELRGGKGEGDADGMTAMVDKIGESLAG